LAAVADEPATPTYLDACFTRNGKLLVACNGTGLDVRVYGRDGDVFSFESTIAVAGTPSGIDAS